MKAIVGISFLAVIALLAWGFYIVSFQLDTPEKRFSFITSMYSSIFSTLIVGFMAAIAVYFFQTRSQTAKEEQNTTVENLKSQERVLKIMENDLERNLQNINGRALGQNEGKIVDDIVAMPVDATTWASLSNSGDTKYLPATLVASLSMAYSSISTVHSWSDRFVDSKFGAGSSLSYQVDGKMIPVSNFVLNSYRNTIARAITPISKGISDTNVVIKENTAQLSLARK